MNILEEIIQHKHKEVAERKKQNPMRALENTIYFNAAPVSLCKSVTEGSGIIAEIKRKSPSKGIINPNVSVENISIGYANAGASGLSVLTDTKYFGGTNDDLLIARKLSNIPILRKDFVVDEFQIVEAKSIGANAILLIAASLTHEQIKLFARLAHSLQLEVLLEVHNENELLTNLEADADLIGVNNRDLKTFVTDIEISRQLVELIPGNVVKVSESGIEKPETIIELSQIGYQGFLMGQNFMQTADPGAACFNFINTLNKLKE
jgi:indole-3-glycerol phosphate synthase